MNQRVQSIATAISNAYKFFGDMAVEEDLVTLPANDYFELSLKMEDNALHAGWSFSFNILDENAPKKDVLFAKEWLRHVSHMSDPPKRAEDFVVDGYNEEEIADVVAAKVILPMMGPMNEFIKNFAEADNGAKDLKDWLERAVQKIPALTHNRLTDRGDMTAGGNMISRFGHVDIMVIAPVSNLERGSFIVTGVGLEDMTKIYKWLRGE